MQEMGGMREGDAFTHPAHLLHIVNKRGLL